MVSIDALMHPIDKFNEIYNTFAQPVANVLQFMADVAVIILQFIKEILMQRLSAWARTVRGYFLVTVIIGKDPFTDAVVELNVENIIHGFMSLMEGGEEQFQQMKESGSIARATQRIDAAVERLNMTPQAIVQLFIDLWNSFSINDLADPIAAFGRIIATFGEPILRLIAFVIEIVKIVVVVILEIMNFPFATINNIITRTIAAFQSIKRDPIGFLKNLLRAIKQGFIQFFDNIVTHLINGVVGWLMSELKDAGIPALTDFSLQGVIGWVLQVLGLTMEKIWEKLAAHPRIGPARVARLRSMINTLEGIWTFIKDVQERGIAAIWEKIQEQLSNLWNVVLDAVKGWVMQTIVTQVTVKLLGMLDPTGIMAVINSCIAIYSAIQSFIKYMREMLEILNAFVNGVADIAEGNVTTAANYLENTMGRAMPVIIGFLANQVGLGGVGRRVGEMIEGVRTMVDEALTWLVNKAVDTGMNLLDRAMAAGRSAVGAVMGWLGLSRPFRTQAGETHTISIEEVNGQMKLMLASRKDSYERKIENINIDTNDAVKVAAKSNALRTAASIDSILRNRGTEDPGQRANIRRDLNNLIVALERHTALIMPPENAGRNLVINPNDLIQVLHGQSRKLAVVESILDESGNMFITYRNHETEATFSGRVSMGDMNRLWWRGSLEGAILTPADLATYSAFGPNSAWPDMRIARAVLNFRRANVQRNFNSSKEWEHKVEQSTGLPQVHSAINLFWVDGDFNRWLGTELGRPRQKEIVEGDRTRLVSWREYLQLRGDDDARTELKERLYRIRGYREVDHNDANGFWRELTR